MKQPTKAMPPATTGGHTAERPTATDTLVAIADLAIAHRFTNRPPSLADLVRVVGSGSNTLRYGNRDEKTEVQNAAVMQIARQRGLVS
jgi:hypothetical protein